MWLEYNGGRKQVHHVMDIIFVSSILMDAILRFVLGSNKSWVSKWIHGSYLRKNLAGNSKIMKLQDDLYIEYGLNGVWCITPPKNESNHESYITLTIFAHEKSQGTPLRK